MKKIKAESYGTSYWQKDSSLGGSEWLNWQALTTGFLVFWAIILVGLSVLWWSGGMITIRLIVIKQLKENAIELVIPEGWRY